MKMFGCFLLLFFLIGCEAEEITISQLQKEITDLKAGYIYICFLPYLIQSVC